MAKHVGGGQTGALLHEMTMVKLENQTQNRKQCRLISRVPLIAQLFFATLTSLTFAFATMR